MARIPNITINPNRCDGCGLCVRVCPCETLSVVEGKANVTGQDCMGCGHCSAVCPHGAITVEGIGEVELQSIRPDDAAFQLVELMKQRRSCRAFKPDPVSREILEDLVAVGTTAPSGTNSQLWKFTVIPARDGVENFGDLVAGFYRRLNRLARNPVIRALSKLVVKDGLCRYYRLYYQSIENALQKWEKHREDQLFHGAPAVLIISTANEASTGKEDALMAAQNISLAAHAMGLGTCLIGFAVEAMARDRRIAQGLNIPEAETVHAVITVGHPAVTYVRAAGRKTAEIRISCVTKVDGVS